MEEKFDGITNDLYELKAAIRQVVNKYNIKYLGIDITDKVEDVKSLEEIKTKKTVKDITLSIEL